MTPQHPGTPGELYENESSTQKAVADKVSVILEALDEQNLQLGEFLTALVARRSRARLENTEKDPSMVESVFHVYIHCANFTFN